MANTLSGKLAEITVVDPITVSSNASSSRALYRYVGIMDKVVRVETAQTPLTGYTNEDTDARILLAGQTTASENGVYVVQADDSLVKVAHSLEDGNLVEDRTNADNSSASVFRKYSSADDSWAEVTFTDA